MLHVWQLILALFGGGLFGTGVAWAWIMKDRSGRITPAAMLVSGCLLIMIGLVPGLNT
ncbi:hypothetical protein [Sphingomonas sp. PP-CC-3G-468]|uniref:hypothetical protein n=1 Tax=Sphingomonas sp. PP-CC-3G-468 TaxID=2135656 RepID=UPI001404C5C7|nr:hypothetical protein [Sphingomonas sp. PP-CC-3G-468]